MRRRHKSGLSSKSDLSPKSGPNSIEGCLLIIAGLMIIGGVYWVHAIQLEFARTAQSTMGTIIEMNRGGAKNNGYSPVVQFITPNEHVYTVSSAIASNPPAYEVGDLVEILYNPEAPEQAMIVKENSFTLVHQLMWAFGAVGIGLCMKGVYPIMKAFRWMQ